MGERLLRILPHSVMLVVACLLYWAATRIDAETGGRIGPAVWPKAIIVFMGLLCAYEIVKRLVVRTDFMATGVVSNMAEADPPPGSPSPLGEGGGEDHYKMLFGGIALIAAYVFAVPWLGFFASTAVFLAVFPWVGGLRKPVVSVVVSAVGTVTLAIVFLKFAYISLPLGEGPFRALSVGLMRLLGVT